MGVYRTFRCQTGRDAVKNIKINFESEDICSLDHVLYPCMLSVFPNQ